MQRIHTEYKISTRFVNLLLELMPEKHNLKFCDTLGVF